jgi:branched-chain amino acid transport system permease protein
LVVIAVAQLQPQATNLLIMLATSMVFCGLFSIVIERFAYRPMRGHSRDAALITAIGVSLLLQFGGAMFLPTSPPPSISEKVNPYRETLTLSIVPPPADIVNQRAEAKPEVDRLQADFDAYLKRTGESQFQLSPEGAAIKQELAAAQAKFRSADDAANTRSVRVVVQQGQLLLFCIALLLMIGLRYLVMKTPTGRAMRAVSHDFDSASLMGINVNQVVTITFVIGSALAGAGAMMTASFLGTPLTTFYGVQPGVKAFVAAVLGGIGNIPGAVVGGLLMGVVETLFVWAAPAIQELFRSPNLSGYKDAIAFIVLIVVLLFRPGGILGSSKVEKV